MAGTGNKNVENRRLLELSHSPLTAKCLQVPFDGALRNFMPFCLQSGFEVGRGNRLRIARDLPQHQPPQSAQ